MVGASHAQAQHRFGVGIHLRSGAHDLVIGKPLGNDEYSGSNREEIARQWAARFGHAEGGLMDPYCFLRRAVELARPDGGPVCLLVPEGLLARGNRDGGAAGGAAEGVANCVR